MDSSLPDYLNDLCNVVGLTPSSLVTLYDSINNSNLQEGINNTPFNQTLRSLPSIPPSDLTSLNEKFEGIILQRAEKELDYLLGLTQLLNNVGNNEQHGGRWTR